jgi:hypothetical protein
VLAEALLSGQAEEVVRRVIGAALEGDAMAQRLCMERIIAPRRLERVHFAMPVLATGADAAKALAAVAQAVAKGELAPAEAGDLAALVQSFVHSLETQELETRLQAVEKAAAQARTQSRW